MFHTIIISLWMIATGHLFGDLLLLMDLKCSACIACKKKLSRNILVITLYWYSFTQHVVQPIMTSFCCIACCYWSLLLFLSLVLLFAISRSSTSCECNVEPLLTLSLHCCHSLLWKIWWTRRKWLHPQRSSEKAPKRLTQAPTIKSRRRRFSIALFLYIAVCPCCYWFLSVNIFMYLA